MSLSESLNTSEVINSSESESISVSPNESESLSANESQETSETMSVSRLSQNSDVENTLEVSDSNSSIDDIKLNADDERLVISNLDDQSDYQDRGNDEKDKQASDDKLPEADVVKENSGLMSGILATMGGIFLFKNRRRKKRDNQSS
ncbi:hypothetical protein [Mammaliicoccus sp. H-M34]|uniref:hypothetical protein n=1 Tax=Mammaliicoccus sp. H-M34 TaxID=2898693 RepID=UPI001EFABC74|nr:hypothetical protein [Mammaliicoccus sp. H-M34]